MFAKTRKPGQKLLTALLLDSHPQHKPLDPAEPEFKRNKKLEKSQHGHGKKGKPKDLGKVQAY
jgi:hypothetical protein